MKRCEWPLHSSCKPRVASPSPGGDLRARLRRVVGGYRPGHVRHKDFADEVHSRRRPYRRDRLIYSTEVFFNCHPYFSDHVGVCPGLCSCRSLRCGFAPLNISCPAGGVAVPRNGFVLCSHISAVWRCPAAISMEEGT